MTEIPTLESQELYDAYHRILELGMENLQRFSVLELFDYLAIEIDHLHNLPHYMHTSNLYVHAYYYCTARPFYIEQLESITVIDTDSLIRYYEPHWNSIRDELMPFADFINAKQYSEKL